MIRRRTHILLGFALCAVLTMALLSIYWRNLLAFAQPWRKTPSKTEFVKKELEKLEWAVEQDSLDDHRAFPGQPYWGPFAPTRFNRSSGWVHTLITLDPIDPFNRADAPEKLRKGPIFHPDHGLPVQIEGLDYWFYSDGSEVIALLSRGPDEDLDAGREGLDKLAQAKTRGAYDAALEPLTQITYDPTNGMLSNGDILRIKRVGAVLPR